MRYTIRKSFLVVVLTLICGFSFYTQASPNYLNWKEKCNNNLLQTKPHVINPNALVFAGGGIKGLAYVGAIQYLKETNKYNQIQYFSGASAGAIFAAMAILNVPVKDMQKIVMDKIGPYLLDPPPGFEYLQKYLLDTSLITKNVTAMLGMATCLIGQYGICDGNKIDELVKSIMKKYSKSKNPDITFGELYNETGKHLVLFATSLCYKDTAIFSDTLTPDFKVADAVRASMAFPGVYKPFYDKTNDDYLVDGGCEANLPLYYFDQFSGVKTLAFIPGTITTHKQKVNNIVQAALSLFSILSDSQRVVFDFGNSYRIIQTDTMGISTFDFDLTPTQKEQLMSNCYNSTKAYFENI